MKRKSSFLKREFRIAMGDRKAFNKEQKNLGKRNKGVEKRLRRLKGDVKRMLKGGFE